MEERDLGVAGAGAGGLVDQLGAEGGKAGELGADVDDAVADVVEPFAAALEESRQGARRCGWGEQLDAGATNIQEDDFDSLRLDGFAFKNGGVQN